jgi:hypothetical protein
VASASVEPSASAKPAAMKSTSGMEPATLESAAQAGRSAAESVTWAEPVAVAASSGNRPASRYSQLVPQCHVAGKVPPRWQSHVGILS